MTKNGKLLTAMILFLFFQGAAARAQDAPRVEIGGHYSYLRANIVADGPAFNLNGGGGSLAVNVMNWLGLVGEVGAVRQGSVPGTQQSLAVTTFLFGPRISYRKFQRVTPFAHALFGAAHGSGSLFSESLGGGTPPLGANTGFAVATGGGVDLNVDRHFAVRVFQADYLHTRLVNGSNDRQNSFRLSVGIVLLFGDH